MEITGYILSCTQVQQNKPLQEKMWYTYVTEQEEHGKGKYRIEGDDHILLISVTAVSPWQHEQ